MIAVTSSAGVTSKAGFHTAAPGGAARTPPNPADLVGAALLDRNRASVGRIRIHGRARRGDIERHVVRPRREGQAVRADLVGHIAVGRDAVGADDDAGHVAPAQPARGHAVGDHGARDAGLVSSHAVSRLP